MPFAAALSEHPVPAQAVGEVAGQVIEEMGVEPDLALLFVAAAHTGAVEDMAGAIRTILRPRTLLGCTASTVVGGGREVEDEPAVALWAGRFGPCTPVRMQAVRTDDGIAVVGVPGEAAAGPAGDGAEPGVLLLLADPFSFPVDALLGALPEQAGVHVPVVGGLASAARAPGGNRLILDGDVVADGAVGALIAGAEVGTVVSQGCRPIGDPMIVTRGGGQAIEELAGQPALERLEQVLRGLPPDDLQLAQGGLHVGRVVDEHKVEHERGDFLIRNLVGADRSTQAIAVGDEIEVGATVQFQVRDREAADEDLRQLMASRHADGALLFTCNGRGTHLFGEPDHDAGLVHDSLGGVALAGMSCAGEIGPVGGRSFLHGFTASVLLLRDRG